MLFNVNYKIYQTNSFGAKILSANISKDYKEKENTLCHKIKTEKQGELYKVIEYGEECAQFYEELQEDISYGNAINRTLIKQELDHQFGKEISFISYKILKININT